MSKIFRYDLEVIPRQPLWLPANAGFLNVIVKDDMPRIYAVVDEDAKPELRILRTIVAGEEFNDEGLHYIDTFVIGNWYVGHLFEQFQLGQSDPVSNRYASDYRDLQSERKLAILPV